MGTQHRHKQIPALLAYWADNARHATAFADAEIRLAQNATSLGQSPLVRRRDTAILGYQSMLGKDAQKFLLAIGLCPQNQSTFHALVSLRILDQKERNEAVAFSTVAERFLPKYTHAPNRKEIYGTLTRLGHKLFLDNHPVWTLVEQGICPPNQTAELRQTALIENFLFQPSDHYPHTQAADAMLGFVLDELFQRNVATTVLAIPAHCRDAIPPSTLKWSGADQKISTNSQGQPVPYLQWNLSNQPHRACPAHWTRPKSLKP
ncbi:MAG: hypothetical protein IPI58_08230 [Alphaproteobacteria bacterium]|nr:MAG: hypothetical protein IPI58_08230 [Alphaproteobacteria bacterium]